MLRLLGQLTGRIMPDPPTRSEQMLKRGVWYFQNSESEDNSDTESSDESSGNEMDSDDDSSSARPTVRVAEIRKIDFSPSLPAGVYLSFCTVIVLPRGTLKPVSKVPHLVVPNIRCGEQ